MHIWKRVRRTRVLSPAQQKRAHRQPRLIRGREQQGRVIASNQPAIRYLCLPRVQNGHGHPARGRGARGKAFLMTTQSLRRQSVSVDEIQVLSTPPHLPAFFGHGRRKAQPGFRRNTRRKKRRDKRWRNRPRSRTYFFILTVILAWKSRILLLRLLALDNIH